jgi:hypothetical protein
LSIPATLSRTGRLLSHAVVDVATWLRIVIRVSRVTPPVALGGGVRAPSEAQYAVSVRHRLRSAG